MKRFLLAIIISILSFQTIIHAQEFLHAEGNYISNGVEEVILRGIGTGNWMLQEGYMMQTSDVAPTQHEFRNRLIQTIGEANTDSFYNAWLAWHFTRTDVDSMKSWGFNSVRVAMHYKWFTLPVEDEPVSGENTWFNKGFVIIDSLLDWCSANEMYLILDLHGAPGGQGTDAAISDYDPTKPSLWESQENKDKTIALWQKLAERYSDELWIGGYDLINETNWDFGDPNNTPMWNLMVDITEAIREVDQNHIIIVEGNWFANDYTGVPLPWDNNLVFSFHKYWTTNTPSSLDWAISLRNTYNVPIWLGESGENSNTWFRNLIALCEANHIGWSWWPVKKPRVNNPLRVEVNEDYNNLIDYWRGNAPAPTVEEAFQAVIQFAENHRIENCICQKDVIDAMIRQPFSTATITYFNHKPGSTIFATDYDLGRNNYAYFDIDTGNYHLSMGGDWMDWNQGWAYRNDGVDIEECNDTDETNGYNVGWTEEGEWLQYTLTTDSLAAYTLNIRYASNNVAGTILILSNEIPVTGNISLPVTGGWQNWETLQVENVILPNGEIKIKVDVENSGFNLNYIKFTNPQEIDSIDFLPLYAETSIDGDNVILYLNKEITTQVEDLIVTDFLIYADGLSVSIKAISIDAMDSRILDFQLDDTVHYGSELTLSYSGSSVYSLTDTLQPFSDFEIVNKLPVRHTIPGRIQAEDYYFNNGFELEICQDAGGGYNTAYAASGDYLDYLVEVTQTGEYILDFRIATIRIDAELIIQIKYDENYTSLDTMLFTPTGDWQNWQTQSTRVNLIEGRYTLRLSVKQGEHNLNWFEFRVPTAITKINSLPSVKIYPNPTQQYAIIELPINITGNSNIEIFNTMGRFMQNIEINNSNLLTLDTSQLVNGIYLIQIRHNQIPFDTCVLLINK